MDRYLVTDVEYKIECGEPVIYLRTTDKNGQSIFFKKRDFKPYFYVSKDEYKELDKNDKGVHKTINGYDVVKKYTKKPSDVSDVRDDYSRTWESDIPFLLRFLIDRNIKSGIKINGERELVPEDIGVNEISPTKLYLDIETTTTKETVNLDPDKNDVRIVSIVLRYVDDNTDTDEQIVLTAEKEKKILDDFIECVIEKDPVMLLAWNSYFDMGTIFKNCKKLGVDINKISPLNTVYKRGYGDKREIVCKGRKIIDLMYAYDRYYTNRNLETKALEPVCENEIGIEQSHFDYDKLLEGNWQNNIDEIVEYNKLDVERMVRLDKELRIINHFEELRRTTGCMFKQAYRTSGFVDVLMLRAFKDKFVLPRSRKREHEKFRGGLVKLMSEAGVYDWVAVLDFHAHYPTGIKNYNMSPETLVDDDYKGDYYELETEMGTVRFKQEPRGILPSIFDEMEEHRNKLKAKRDKYDKGTDEWEYYNGRQYSRKQIINSIFGYFGYPGSRLYIPKLVASVTRAGRKYIEDTIEYVENSFNVETHYSDSLDYNRKIIIKGKDGVDIVKIGDFVENYDCEKYKTLAMNTDDGSVSFKDVVQGISHSYDYKEKGKLLKFNTTRGKTVVTPQHSVYKLENGTPKLVDAKELKKGDKLVSGSNLPSIEKYKSGYDIDLSELDYNSKTDKLRGYKIDDMIKYVGDVCPICGEVNSTKHHLYVNHKREKRDLDDITDEYKYIGCENSKSGKVPRYIELNEELAWVLGYYCADGSVSLGSKKILSFGKQDKSIIKRVQKYFNDLLNEDYPIIEDVDKRTGNKMYYYRISNRTLVYLICYGFGCGHKSSGKEVPKIILNSEDCIKTAFLNGYMSGDGSIVSDYDERYVTDFKDMRSKSVDLMIGMNYLLKTLDQGNNGNNEKANQVLWYYRKDKKDITELRTVVDNNKINGAKIREIKEVKPTKKYVYDIEVEDEHNFMDAEGNILVHNTDSIFFSVDADNKEDAVKRAKEIEESINSFWQKISEENNLYGRPDIECEKIYKSIFFKGGTKKRYAGLKIWEEGKFCDEISVSGFEIVRTDEAKATKKAQQGLFDIILRENDFDKMCEHINNVIKELKNADKAKNLGKPSPIRMKPEEYERPYSVHGSIWSNKNLDKEFGITQTKPYLIHIKSLPEGYSDVLYIPKEKDGKPIRRHIERIALSADDDLDMWKKHIDYDKHIEKLVKDKVEPILTAIGYSFSEVRNGQKQASMDNWM